MKILIVGLVKNEQVNRLRQEAEKRGHSLEGAYPSDLVIYSDSGKFEPTLKGKTIDHDVIYLWATGEKAWEWITVGYFLNKTRGTKIVNYKTIDPLYLYALSPAIDYLKQVENNLPFPKSVIIFKSNIIDDVMKDFKYPVIVKSSVGKQGKGIYKVESVEEIKKIIDENKEDTPSFIIREFIPNDGDIRVFTIGYKAIGAMKRTPKKGDFRSNISQGGTGESYDLSKNFLVQEIAEKISKIMRTEIAGVDIMLHAETNKPYILEINPGPQFLGLEKYTNINTALEIVKYFESL